jgi:hypothetical protein
MTDLEQTLQPDLGYFQLGILGEANQVIKALPTEWQDAKATLDIRGPIHLESRASLTMREVSGFLVHEWP